MVMEEFKEQLIRSDDRWYETALPCKPNHLSLPCNRNESLRCLNSLLRKLKCENMLMEYNYSKELLKRLIIKRRVRNSICHTKQSKGRTLKLQNYEWCKMRL